MLSTLPPVPWYREKIVWFEEPCAYFVDILLNCSFQDQPRHSFLYVLHTCAPRLYVARVCSLFLLSLFFFPSNMQPFVLMAATTSSCSTRKGSVPEMCTPSSWRWLMRRYDLWLLLTRPILFSFAFFNFGRRQEGPPPPPHPHPVALVILSDLVIEHQAKGGQRKRNTTSATETQIFFFFFCLPQTPEGDLWTEGHVLDSQTKQ